MDGSVVQTYLSDVLHAVSQALLAPDIILLLAFIGYALFCIGSVIAERFSERRHFKVVMPQFLADLMAAKEDEIPEVIAQSGLLKRQKAALQTVYDYRSLPGEALVALIRRLVSEEETRYDRITGRNNIAARVAPMLGLMGTLIPLGPGIQALGNADTAALSSSLLVAFDTTVAGLVAAAVCLIAGKIRSNWYGNYMSALDAAMATMLQKIEDMRGQGAIEVKTPENYAFLYGAKEQSSQRSSAAAAKPAEQATNSVLEQARASAGTAAALANASAVPATAQQARPAAAGEAASSAAQPAARPLREFAPASGAPARWQPPIADSATIASDASKQGTGPLFNPLPDVSTASANPSSTSPFAQVSPTATTTSDNASATRVAPPVQEVPMPAFIDALAAAGVSADTAPAATQVPTTAPAQNVAGSGAMPSATNFGWYQPRSQGGTQAGEASSRLWTQPQVEPPATLSDKAQSSSGTPAGQ